VGGALWGLQVKFLSVCSGIEAASVAWQPLGWKAVAFSEIEPFPCAVLAHHYPDVPNLGDMTLLPERIASGDVEAPDLLCGGTPCQAFSVAGLRQSLDDARGNLSLTFCEIANVIDSVRSVRGQPPCIVFWENVPGVLSTADNAFGCFLAGLAGENDALQPPGGKWSNAGCVYGPKRTVAWRVLDAQFFGLAQRRRRVFVVASARKGFDPTEILFEFDGVRRDTAPSREEGQAIAPCVTSGPPFSRTGNERVEAETIIAVLSYAIQGSMIGRNDQAGPQGNGINEEVCFTQNTIDRHGVAYGIRTANTSSNGWGIQEEVTHTLDTAQGVAVAQSMQVRRLTPVECERLQGFPDGYTAIPWRKKQAGECPDGPRYKALGNSWAVPNIRWIGERIQAVENLSNNPQTQWIPAQAAPETVAGEV
jgi:DNA (cytosine-5)-methyltransferase 1